MRVFLSLEFSRMTFRACVLLHSHEFGVTCVAREFDLIVPVGCLARRHDLLCRRVDTRHGISEVADAQQRQHNPSEPEIAVWNQVFSLAYKLNVCPPALLSSSKN